MRKLKEKYINPFTDYGFKRLFGEEPNKVLLIDFLNELLRHEQGAIMDVTYLKNENLPVTEEERMAVFDIYCINESGERFIVELQKTKQTFFKDRVLYYSTFAITEQAVKGQDWNYELKKVYSISILDFTFDAIKSDLPNYHHTVKLVNMETGKVFMDKLTFIFLEMPKFTKSAEELQNRYEKWLFILKNLSVLDRIPATLKEDTFEKLFETAEIAKFNKKEAMEYKESLKQYRDLKNSLDTAREEAKKEGREEGREEGIEIGTEKVAIKMLKAGLPVETIKEYTGLTSEHLAKLKQEIDKS
jgi:predicted transposase/invertase (TIGR01784 family)